MMVEETKMHRKVWADREAVRWVPNVMDFLPDVSCMTEEAIAHAVIDHALQEGLLYVFDQIQKVEMEGNYVGEHGTFDVVSHLSTLKDLAERLTELGPKAARSMGP